MTIKGLSSPIKRHTLEDQIKIQDLGVCCLQEMHLKDKHKLRVKDWEKIPSK
jgi:hypothetical protein